MRWGKDEIRVWEWQDPVVRLFVVTHHSHTYIQIFIHPANVYFLKNSILTKPSHRLFPQTLVLKVSHLCWEEEPFQTGCNHSGPWMEVSAVCQHDGMMGRWRERVINRWCREWWGLEEAARQVKQRHIINRKRAACAKEAFSHLVKTWLHLISLHLHF